MRNIKVARFGGNHCLYLPFHAAVEFGFFKQAGLKVELYDAGNDHQVHHEVASGCADFGIGDPTFVANSQGSTVIVAALVNGVANWGVTHYPEIEQITRPEDFVHLRLATYPRPSTSFSLLSALKLKHRSMLKSFQIIEAEIGNQLVLLQSGGADVALEIEPMVSLAEEKGLRVVLSMSDFYGDFLFSGIMTRRGLCEKDPKLVQSFITALQFGLSLCHADSQAATDVASKMYPALARSGLERAVNRMKNSRLWPEQLLLKGSSFQAAINLRRELGDIKGEVVMSDLVDQSFAYQAIQG